MLARGMHILNGCSLLPTHTCTTTQHAQMVARSSMDYVILSDATLHMAKRLAIEDHPPRRKAKNFHANLVLTLTCQQGLLQSPEVDNVLRCHFRWVSSMEMAWQAWTDSEDFA